MKGRALLLCIGLASGVVVLAPMIGYARLGMMQAGSAWATSSSLSLADVLPVALGTLLFLVSLGAAKYRAAVIACGALIGIALYETCILVMYPPLTDGSLHSNGTVYGPTLVLLALASVSFWKVMFARRSDTA